MTNQERYKEKCKALETVIEAVRNNEIECNHIHASPLSWRETNEVSHVGVYDHRIKPPEPEPVYERWTMETFPLDRPIWIRRIGSFTVALVFHANGRGVRCSAYEIDWDVLFKNYEHTTDGKTWGVCGTKKGGEE